MIPKEHLDVLRKIYARLEDTPINWVLTGSLGMALQGVPVEVHDIDIQTDRRGAYEMARRLAEYVVKPVRYSEAERIRSHYGALEIDGLQVEVMGDVQKRLDEQRWEEPVKLENHKRWVEIEEMRVPVLSLEYESQAYLRLGRSEKAKMLQDWLKRNNDRNDTF